jgi:ribonuclease HII
MKATAPLNPDFVFESAFTGPVCGVDEAGRGPCAGPLAVAAVILDAQKIPEGIRDSKKLSEKQRLTLSSRIRAQSLAYTIIMISPIDIDRINIFQATLLGMKQAVEGLKIPPIHALIDGNKLPELAIPASALVKGDARSLSIAAASILAKVARDEIMIEADKIYPQYGFARHKGYQSPEHLEAIRIHGPCAIHRRSWATVSRLS